MNKIAEIIDQQLNLLTELQQVITTEKQALIAQDADNLLRIAQQKASLLDQLKTNDLLIAEHPDKPQLTQAPQLITQMSEAKKKLASCQQLNAENSSLIELSIASVNRFSQALQKSRNASSLTYDNKGKTSTISTLGSNIKA